MNAQLIDVLKGFGQMWIVTWIVLCIIAICLYYVVRALDGIRNELKNLVAETAYLATIDDDDEREGK